MNVSRTLPTERRQLILQLLSRSGSMSVAELSSQTGASLATIHRDLEQLGDSGRLVRVHGGATLPDDDPPVAAERRRNVGAKRAIARFGSDLIEPGFVVLLEASSTVSMMSEFLPKEGIIVVTNDPDIALSVSHQSNNEVIILGGTYRRQTGSIVGEMTVSLLREINVDLAFVGVSAISTAGLTSINLIEAETKRAILACGERSIGLATRDKLGRSTLTSIGGIDQLAMLITDAPASDSEVQELTAAGLDVVSVEP